MTGTTTTITKNDNTTTNNNELLLSVQNNNDKNDNDNDVTTNNSRYISTTGVNSDGSEEYVDDNDEVLLLQQFIDYIVQNNNNNDNNAGMTINIDSNNNNNNYWNHEQQQQEEEQQEQESLLSSRENEIENDDKSTKEKNTDSILIRNQHLLVESFLLLKKKQQEDQQQQEQQDQQQQDEQKEVILSNKNNPKRQQRYPTIKQQHQQKQQQQQQQSSLLLSNDQYNFDKNNKNGHQIRKTNKIQTTPTEATTLMQQRFLVSLPDTIDIQMKDINSTIGSNSTTGTYYNSSSESSLYNNTSTANIGNSSYYNNGSSSTSYGSSSYNSSSKAYYNDVRIDYSVLSVGVMTLGLIMVVELLRHKLDTAAYGRPFFKTVLEGVYTELATLGIVEFFLYILTEYYHNYDKAKKAVFGDVHFLLFYVAIINAFQSSILAIITMYHSNKMWIVTENFNLYHYIELREEFTKLQSKLQLLHTKRTKRKDTNNKPNDTIQEQQQEQQQQQQQQQDTTTSTTIVRTTEHEFVYTRDGFLSLYNTIIDTIRYPRLKYKYDILLIQIRFHELRISFLQAYNMPIRLRISNYLIRCQIQILIKLVHVSSIAWLALTLAANILYYILGIISYKFQDPELVGTILIWIYFSSLVLFIWIAWLTYNKMKSIFRSMMNDKNLWDISNSSSTSSNTSDETNTASNNNNNNSSNETERLKTLQLAMFWGNEPSIVIAVIQFMQFGYALFCSALIIFWNEIKDASIPMYLYVLSIVICYCIFLLLIGLVIPRYTMCTSLAQLVNIPLLRETLASFHLEEAKRKHYELQQYTNDQLATATATANNENKKDEDNSTMNGSTNMDNDNNNNDSDKSSSSPPPPPPPPPSSSTMTLYENETLLLPTTKTTTITTIDTIPVSFVPNYVARRNQRQKYDTTKINTTDNTVHQRQIYDTNITLLSGIESTTPRASETTTSTTKNDLKDLEHIFPTNNNNNNSTSALEGRKRNRRKNMKSISDGVSLMAKMNSMTTMNFHDDTGLLLNSTTNHTLYASGNNDCDLSSQQSSSAASSSKKSLSKSNHYNSTANYNNNNNNNNSRPVINATRNKFAVESADVMAQLVGKSTSELRNVLSELEKQRRDAVVLPTSNKALRPRRIKSKSDGVSEMTETDNINNQLTYSITHNDQSSSIFDNNSSIMSMPNSILSSSDVLTTTTDQLITSNRPRARRRDRRSVSDGVALMAKISSAETNNNDYNTYNVKKSISLSAANMTKACAAVDPLTETTTMTTTTVEESTEAKTTKPDPTSVDYKLYTLSADSNKTIVDDYDDTMTEDNSDGYWSDADDIPEFNWTSDDQLEQSKKHNNTISAVSMKQQLRDYFGGKKYIVVSNLFGTTPAFFLIAKRVESFLHSQGIVEEKFVSFHFRLDATFWILFCWLLFFWIGSVVTFIVMSPLHKLKTTNEKKVAVAAVIDYIISFVCIIVFSFAEMRRCCRDTDTSLDYNNNRYLGTTMDSTTYPDNDIIDIGNVCTCLPYGSRTYGGLGTLEPYVSLIALRLARHYIAKRIVVYFGNGKKGASTEVLTNDDIADPFDVFNEDHDKGGGHGHGHGHNKSEDMVGTAAQLWEAAIVRYPEISQQYGEFSGELLRAMLGMPLSISIPKVDEQNNKSQSNVVDDVNVKPFSTRIGHQHLRLSSKLPLERLFSFTSDNDQENGMENGLPRVLNYEQENEFSYPNACLIRNMRRCDRKLLPLLEKWIVVDVVMTRYEIVYFDVASIADESLYDDTIRRSLVDTKGGKQLRLCDVAIGRTVVGILLISDIQSLYVDRYLPGAAEYRQEHFPDIEIASTEFWQVRSNNTTVTTRSEKRSMEWNTIKQDVLQIRIGHNRSVLLRFYSDFEEAIRHPEQLIDEDEMFGTIFKNNSFLWVQTIGRICGRDQLSKQNLPHYGNDNVDEIRDYIVVHHPPQSSLTSSSISLQQQNHHHTHPESLQQHRRLQSFRMTSHRRIQSVGEELFKLEGGMTGHSTATTPIHGSGLMSTIEEGGGSTTNLTKPKLLRASTMAAFTGSSTTRLNSSNNSNNVSAATAVVARPSLTRPTLRRALSSSDDGVQQRSLSSSLPLPSQQPQQYKKKSSNNTMSLTTTTILEGDESEQKSTRHLITDDSTSTNPNIVSSSSSPITRPKIISSRSRSFGFT